MYLSHLRRQVEDAEERVRECNDDTLDCTVKDPDRDPWTMRKNEDIKHLLDVIIRARFVAQLFAAINYATSRREKTVLWRVRRGTYSRGHKKEGINNTHKTCREKRGRSEWLVYEEN